MTIRFLRSLGRLNKFGDNFASGQVTGNQSTENLTVTNSGPTYSSGGQTVYQVPTGASGSITLTSTPTGTYTTPYGTRRYNSYQISPGNITIGGEPFPAATLSVNSPRVLGNVTNTPLTKTGPDVVTGAVNPKSFSFLLVASGGSTGNDPNFESGGGAGGMCEGTVTISAGMVINFTGGTYSITSPTHGGSLSAFNGGPGGTGGGSPGGSGGGGGNFGWGTHPGGSATQTPQGAPYGSGSGYGNPGGTSNGGKSWGSPAAGGGGAGGGGGDPGGGGGRSSSISGSSITYSRGGNGSKPGGNPGPPGQAGDAGNANDPTGGGYGASGGIVYLRR